MTVVVAGDINVDLEIALPAMGVDLEHRHPDPVLTGGGSAANTAAALGRLGVETRFIGTVGSDSYGIDAVASLAGAGVDVALVAAVPTGNTVMVLVVVPADGERLIYVWPPRGGAHLELTVDGVMEGLDGADWFHVSGIALRGEPAATALLTAMEAARAARIPVSLDTNLRLENWGWETGFRDTIDRAVDLADVVFGNLIEEIVPLASEHEPGEALRVLSRPDRLVIGRVGAGGAVAHDGNREVSVGGYEIDVVDTVGAGDAFDAGFIAARLESAGLSESLAYANAVAALGINRPGARSTPNAAEVTAFMVNQRT
jgi:aminoimidazole riboside kinase